MSDNNINAIDDIDFDSINFDNAKPVSEEPMLSRLQAERNQQQHNDDISIRVDSHIVAQFREQAKATNTNYQSLINQALKEYLVAGNLQEIVKQTIRQEMQS